METRISEVAKLNGVDEQIAIDTVLRQYELDHLIPKEELTTISIDINNEVEEYLDKMKKLFKVSYEATISACLISYLEKIKKQAKKKSKKKKK